MRVSRRTRLALASLLAVLAGSLVLASAAFADNWQPSSLPFTSYVSIGTEIPCGATICATVVCPTRYYPVRVSGQFPNDCWTVRRVELVHPPAGGVGPPTIRILFDDRGCLDRACNDVPTPWSIDTVAWGLPAGDYVMRVEVVNVSCSDSFPPDSVHSEEHALGVHEGFFCPVVRTLPYVDEVEIGQPPCATCAPVVCADEPFVVTLSGTLPGDCVSFRGLSLVPVVNIRPGPPIVRATFSMNECLGQRCDYPDQRKWSASIVVPAQPAGGNGLTVQSVQVWGCDPAYELWTGQQAFPFTVPDSCPPREAICLSYDWAPRPASSGACNADFVNDTASVDLRIASARALGALQGVLHVEPGLEVRGLHPIGPASDMTLEWTRTPLGAAFILITADGTPIPPYWSVGDDTAYNFSPVLRVEVKSVPYVSTAMDQPKTVFAMEADSLYGVDAHGAGVPLCLQRCVDTYGNRCALPTARFCRAPRCDVNQDGHADVRDLVRMVQCLHQRGCLGPPVAYDCNGDGLFSILDVLCCARAMLNGYETPGGGGQSDPAIGLAFDEPVRTGDELELPFTLAGADRVGATRMLLRFPSNRYDVESFGLVGNPPGWLALHEVTGEQLVVELVASDASQAGANLPLLLRLKLRPGADHGGEVIVREADVSSAEGAALATSIVGSGAIVDPTAAIELSAVHPNPGAGPMRFTLTLPRASDVDLAIHDLAGRRVATVHHGAMAPGLHPLTWDGRTDRGEPARDGVYFLRLRAGETEIARKAVLVRGR